MARRIGLSCPCGNRPSASRWTRRTGPFASGMSEVSTGPSLPARRRDRSAAVGAGISAAERRTSLPAADLLGISPPLAGGRVPRADDSSDLVPIGGTIGPADPQDDA